MRRMRLENSRLCPNVPRYRRPVDDFKRRRPLSGLVAKRPRVVLPHRRRPGDGRELHDSGRRVHSRPRAPLVRKAAWNVPQNGTYDLAPDGRRIVGVFPVDSPGAERSQSHVTFLLNFADEIRRRLGTGR